MGSAATRLTEFSFDMQQSGSKQDPHALAAAALVLAVALAPGRATTPGVDSHLDTAHVELYKCAVLPIFEVEQPRKTT